MKHILCIVNCMNTGGAETFLMKLYRTVDRTRYQFDFCTSEPEAGFYEEEIQHLGGRIYRITGKSKNPMRFVKSLYNLIKNEKYQYVMRLGSNSIVALDLLIAKCSGAKRTVLRSTNSSVGKGLKDNLCHHLLFWLPKVTTDVKIAPSNLAAEFMFGKKAVQKGNVLILNNGIDVKQFIFDSSVRASKRAELGLGTEFTVCHVGRFSSQKNHRFLIAVFREIVKQKPDAQLFLVGQGELEQDIRTQVAELGLQNNVHFLGIRSDVPQLLMAMDVLVFPSFYEGMPNVVIEAQATGLHCLISDRITKEAAVTDRVEYLSLNESPEHWAKTALKYALAYERPDMTEIYKEKWYEISAVAKRFCEAVFDNGGKEQDE